MQAIIDLLDTQMNKPIMYQAFSQSWFHYLSLVLFFFIMISLTKRYRDSSDRDVKKFLRLMALILIFFEILKQINYTSANNWNYQWYAFPFQFCSTPMYVALIASFLKESKLRDAMYMFLATFGFFSGIAVMLYPSTVFTSTALINIQTMVHHGGIAIMGMVLMANHIQLDTKSFIKGVYVFSTLTGIAIVLNTIHNLWIHDGSFNMFFINPLYNCEIPVLSIFQPLVPAPIFIVIFILGFSLVAFIIFQVRKIFSSQMSRSVQYQVESS